MELQAVRKTTAVANIPFTPSTLIDINTENPISPRLNISPINDKL